MQFIIKVPAARAEHTIEFDELPSASKEFVINYGLKQLLNDAIVSGDDEASRNALLDKKLDKLFEGTLAIREGRAGDPVEAEMKRIARVNAENWFRKNGTKLKDVGKADMAAKIKQYMEYPAVRAKAEEVVAAKAEVMDLD